MINSLKIKKIHPDATIPQRAHDGDLGFDLFSNETVVIRRGETKLVGTGIQCQFPWKFGALIKDRSSIASKKNLFTKAGVIDHGYTGEIKILFHSQSDQDQTIQSGDKIAQMILIPVVDCIVEETDIDEDFSTRGSDGFGSTGG